MAEHLPLEYPDSIRLLKLLARPSGAPLRVALKCVQFSECPIYTALSYTWSDLNELQQINIDGREYWIRKNLSDFLNVVTSLDKDECHWEDTIEKVLTSLDEDECY